MNNLRQAAEMALKALEKYEDEWLDDGRRIYVDDELDALRQALAEPEQEPVATRNSFSGLIEVEWGKSVPIGTKLYTAPPKRDWVEDGE